MAKNAKGHGSSPRIPKRVGALIDGIVQGEIVDDATAVAYSGLCRRSVYYALDREHVRDEIERRARRKLKGFALPAALNRIGKLIHSDSQSLALDASKFVAGVHGVRPAPDVAPPPGSGGVVVVQRFVVQPGATLQVANVAAPAQVAQGIEPALPAPAIEPDPDEP